MKKKLLLSLMFISLSGSALAKTYHWSCGTGTSFPCNTDGNPAFVSGTKVPGNAQYTYEISCSSTQPMPYTIVVNSSDVCLTYNGVDYTTNDSTSVSFRVKNEDYNDHTFDIGIVNCNTPTDDWVDGTSQTKFTFNGFGTGCKAED